MRMPAKALQTWHSCAMPPWIRDTLQNSSKVGVTAFVAIPVLAIVLVAVGVLPIQVMLAVGGGWIGALIAVWLKRTGRLS